MSSPRVLAIVQARMSSERLPGKVLLPVGGMPLARLALEAATATASIDEVVLATSTDADDDVLAKAVQSWGWRVFRGSRDDVLGRFVAALDAYPAEVVVRLTADDPLLDPDVTGAVVSSFLSGARDYVSNILERSWPRGLDTEVLNSEALVRSHGLASHPSHREHVTLFVRMHPEQFRLGNVVAPPEHHRPDLRLCIDTTSDHAVLDQVVGALRRPGECIHIGEVLDWFDHHPEVASLNADVRQRVVFGRAY